MKRVGERTIEWERPPVILSRAAIGGRKEAAGPLGGEFDQTFDDTRLNTETWEQAEAGLQKEALGLALEKAGLAQERLQLVLAGDLLNQCVASTFGLVDFKTPFLGQYGACSTMAQTLLTAAVFVESGAADLAAAVTSSHFCSAERQFRLPLEYGGQRAPTAQWTATAAGCVILGPAGGRGLGPRAVSVCRAVPGTVVDLGVTDPANMGAAMAPAAAHTISAFFRDTGTAPTEYDAVYTGDLGQVGSQLLLQLLDDSGVDLRPVHHDCGLLLYDRETQDVHAGGSGCGCSASVLCGHILRRMERGDLSNVLFCATGALMSTTSQQQGLPIPGICHLVQLRAES